MREILPTTNNFLSMNASLYTSHLPRSIAPNYTNFLLTIQELGKTYREICLYHLRAPIELYFYRGKKHSSAIVRGSCFHSH